MPGKHNGLVPERKIEIIVKENNNVRLFFVTLHRFNQQLIYITLKIRKLKEVFFKDETTKNSEKHHQSFE